MSEIDADFLKQLQEAFVIEAREQLQSFMSVVITLEGSTDEAEKPALAEEILRELHSMKGNSRAAGITTVEAVCQALESALLSLKRKKELLKPDAADVFHAAIDFLDDVISKVEAGQADYLPENFGEILHKLKVLDERQKQLMDANAPSPAAAAALSSAGLAVPFPGAKQAPGSGTAGSGAPGASPGPIAAAPEAIESARAVEDAATWAGSPTTGQHSTAAAHSIALPAAGGGLPSPVVGAAGSFADIGAEAGGTPALPGGAASSGATANHGAAATVSSSGAAGDSAAKSSSRSTGTVSAADKNVTTRIALWKLDKLLRESEEMLILKQISEQHLEDIRDMKTLAKDLSAESLRLANMMGEGKSRATASLRERDLQAFASSLRSFCKEFEQTVIGKMRRQQTEQRLCFNMVDGFIDSVKSLLMQDFTSLLSVVPKIVRDLSRELHKEVELEIFGTEIEIDRRILEEIKDPVIHLVRNSLDHGIEYSAERIANGKPAKAHLKIGARQDESGNVQLIISDDGKGINASKLRAAALREGAISVDEAQGMSETESIELMYRSAVSTSESVTEISGRGLGMAIVRERIQELGGRVLVETTLGAGTSFILQLPTKLSTFRGIQVLVGGQSFIIPTLHVHYAGRVLCSDIKSSGSRNTVNVNGQLTSVQNLADVLHLESRKEFKTRASRNYRQLLLLETGNRIAGFLVDEILHEHEVLVRGLSYPLVRVANISGATILGSGQVVPVLNIADLLETSSKATWADQKLRQQLNDDSERLQRLSEMPIFLVDQHLTSLVMLKSLLESEGYVVNTFDSNESALEGLDLDVPLILLKSSELPETQESGLAYWIRKDLRLKNLPIIFFGSQETNEGKEFSSQLGGNAYFSKTDFDRKQILQLIERLT